ncbi:MAG: hypothetical protein WBA74_22335 [Cyclobacteriaceae bacterium]
MTRIILVFIISLAVFCGETDLEFYAVGESGNEIELLKTTHKYIKQSRSAIRHPKPIGETESFAIVDTDSYEKSSTYDLHPLTPHRKHLLLMQFLI